MGSKKNKVKKVFAPSPAAPNNNNNNANAIDDNTDNLVDELLTELNSRDETVQRESATVLEEVQTRKQSEATQATAPDKAGSKNRFKARQVRLAHPTYSSRVTSLSSRQGKPLLSLMYNHPSTPRRMRS
jgi:OTU domain-containing protein 6